MTQGEFIRTLDQLFELEPGTLSPEHQMRDIDNFDSLKLLEIIAFADEQFGVELNPEQLLKCSTLSELIGVIGAERFSG